MSVGKRLREEAIVSDTGYAKTESGGWSIVLSGGPNDKIGNLHRPPLWRLSGKRLKTKPTELNMEYLKQVSISAGCPPEIESEEPIWGTWHFQWYEVTEPESNVRYILTDQKSV